MNKTNIINESDSSRDGTDVTADNIASAMQNIPFLKYAIRREKGATSTYDKQYWANRMFNTDSVAKIKTNRFFEKEVENISNITDMANKARAMTGDINLSDDEYISVKSHTVSVDIPVSSNTRFGYKDPSVITEFVSFVKEAYRRMSNEDKQAGYNGDHQKILTFFMLHAGLDEALENIFPIPFEKEVRAAIAKAGVSSNRIINIDKVCGNLGISKVKYTTVIKDNLRSTIAIMLKTTVGELEKGRPQRLKLIESLCDEVQDSDENYKLLDRGIFTKLNNAINNKVVTLTQTDIVNVVPVLLELNRLKKTVVYSEILRAYGSNFINAGNSFIKDILKSKNPKDKPSLFMSRLISEVVATSSNESIEESFNQSFAYYLIDNL